MTRSVVTETLFEELTGITELQITTARLITAVNRESR
jgi:hypothetical protein